MCKRIAYRSDYYRIKTKDSSHLSMNAVYAFNMFPFGEQDKMSWHAWYYMDCVEGDHCHDSWIVLR